MSEEKNVMQLINSRRYGIIEFPYSILDMLSEEQFKSITEGMIIIESRMDSLRDSLIYTVISPEFDVVELGSMVPFYDVKVEENDEREVISTEYKKRDNYNLNEIRR